MNDSRQEYDPASSEDDRMNGDEASVIVLGVGNLLLSDDGVGVHVAQALMRDPSVLPAGTVIMDGGTFGLDLAPHLRGVARLVIVDAVHHHQTPGHIATWQGAEVARVFAHPMSVHQVGVDALLGALQLLGVSPPEVAVVGVEPEYLEPGLQLSEPVSRAMPLLIDSVVAAAHGSFSVA